MPAQAPCLENNTSETVISSNPLEASECRAIERILFDGFQPGAINENQVKDDYEAIVKLTTEIKTISKQGILLIGERIYEARTILKVYGGEKGAFSNWLLNTFGNKRSAYNILSYYDFYTSLPKKSLKEKLKQMPVQAVYSLASRKGLPQIKYDIISNYNNEKQKEVLLQIKERLPLAKTDKRTTKDNNTLVLEQLRTSSKILKHRMTYLSPEEKTEIETVLKSLQESLSLNN
jgi:hypothetical protein